MIRVIALMLPLLAIGYNACYNEVSYNVRTDFIPKNHDNYEFFQIDF